MIKVDAHQHFWNLTKVDYPWLVPESGPIYRTFEAPELEPLLRMTGIDKTVIVQAMDSCEDTDYMLETAAAYDWVGGVVGWVPLHRPSEAARQLERYADNRYFKGVRHLIHEEQDPNWIVQPAVMDGLKLLAERGLTYDIVALFPNHLHHVPYLAEQVPDLRIVIDHLAKPPAEDRGWKLWASQLAAAAAFPNVYAKLSGLPIAASADADRTALEPQRSVDYAVEQFGANRLMFGSDWPIANLNSDYVRVWKETNNMLAKYSQQEREAIFGGTASAFYRL